MKSFAWVAVAGAFVGGCSGGADGTDSRGWVLFDADARSAGVVLEEEPGASAAMPLSLDAGERIRYRLGAAKGVLDVEPGRLVVVHGADVLTESFRVGSEVSEDALLVSGSEEGARELATVLGGVVSSRRDGYWLLEVDD